MMDNLEVVIYIFSIFISFIVRLKVSVISITDILSGKISTEWGQKRGPRERTHAQTHWPDIAICVVNSKHT